MYMPSFKREQTLRDVLYCVLYRWHTITKNYISTFSREVQYHLLSPSEKKNITNHNWLLMRKRISGEEKTFREGIPFFTRPTEEGKHSSTSSRRGKTFLHVLQERENIPSRPSGEGKNSPKTFRRGLNIPPRPPGKYSPKSRKNNWVKGDHIEKFQLLKTFWTLTIPLSPNY